MNLEPYDAGLLGGDDDSPTCWWHDYIRSELAAAHDFYQQQVEATPDVSGLVETLKRVELTRDERLYVGPISAASWDNAVIACIEVVVEKHFAAHRKGGL